MTTPTREPLDVAASTDFWWYSTTGPVEVRINNGEWLTTTAGTDPAGVAGWKLKLGGPESDTPLLGYGRNRIAVRAAGSDPAYTGDIWTWTPGYWVSPLDPLVLSALINGCEDPDFVVPDDTFMAEQALLVAQSLLSYLSGGRVHPAGTTTEEFRGVPYVRRVQPYYTPLKEVLGLSRGSDWAVQQAVDITDYRIERGGISLRTSTGRAAVLCGDYKDGELVVLDYRFGSTINAAARQSLLLYARELYLSCINPDECSLPERVTSVSREGLSYAIFDPQTYLDQGKVGVPRVDIWLAAINPVKARTKAGVYTPTSPPGVHV